jgi:TRAP-type C4-dicarboxylate transport system substrate-binding protein
MRRPPNISFGILFEGALKLLWCSVLASAISLGICTVARAENRSVRAHLGYSMKHPLVKAGWHSFSEKLKTEKDAPKIKVFLNGPAGDDFSAIENLARGHYQFGSAALPSFPETFPHAALLAEMGLVGGGNELAATAAITELLAIQCKPCAQIFDRQGIVFLGAYGAAPFVILSYDALNTPLAFQELTTLTPGTAWDRLIISLGGKVNQDFSDAGDLFARGEISAAIATPLELSNPAVKAQTRHILTAPLGAFRGGGAFLASASYWQQLSAEARGSILNALPSAIVSTSIEYKRISDLAIEEAKSEGLIVTQAAQDLAAKIHQHAENDLSAILQTAENRFGLTNASEFASQFLSLNQKFEKLLAKTQTEEEAAQILKAEIFDQLKRSKYGSAPKE